MRRIIYLIAFTALLAGLSQAATIKSLLGDSEHWTAVKWTKAEIEMFGGMPTVLGPERHTVILRYSYYTSDYDLSGHNPIWVAHIDRKDSEAKSRSRTGKGTIWDRGTDVFAPDANVKWAAGQARITFVSNNSYSDANPPELNSGSAEKITRGHMASNLEMKCLGDEKDGDLSQGESFSLANACPQMQGHNAPLWAKLEDLCIEWAAKFDGVAVISGPVFAPVEGEPLPVGKQLLTDGGKDRVKIPIPTHFFKVIIAVKGAKRFSIAFLIPHRTDLYRKDVVDHGLAAFVVPIREIELKTEINFMPALGANNELELAKGGSEWTY